MRGWRRCKRIEQLRQQDQDRAGYHVAAGSLHLRQQEFDKAESELKQALALDPKSSAAHLVLGTLYWARNELAPAGQALKAASDLAPPRSGAKLKYADFKLGTGATEEARPNRRSDRQNSARLSARPSLSAANRARAKKIRRL